jgi:hypothetical protein
MNLVCILVLNKEMCNVLDTHQITLLTLANTVEIYKKHHKKIVTKFGFLL